MGMQLALLDNEQWWGGLTDDGIRMPFGAGPEGLPVSRNLAESLNGNQGVPLLISNKGRYVWSEQPFAFRFDGGTLYIDGDGDSLKLGEGFGDLRGVYREVSGRYFKASGTMPDRLLFTAPQYNTWIEMLYEPTQIKVLRYADSILEQGLAPGVLMIDDNWMELYGDWRFHTGRFPDPQAMIEELHRKGFKVMLWLVPYISPDSLVYRELRKSSLLLKEASGGEPIVASWWNGRSALLDLSNPAAGAWLDERLGELMSLYGVDGFKFDAGDPRSYPRGAVSHTQDANPPSQYCQRWAELGLGYSLNEYRACWRMNGQPLAQRLRDKDHSWDDNGLGSLLPNGIAQGLAGYAFICPDMIGGGEYQDFTSKAASLDQELFVRYAQASALFPMMQFSAAPWRLLDEEHNRCCIEAGKLHARFGEEIAGLAEQSSRTGEPILRHMAYNYPEAGYEAITDQFMLGESLLVAPVLVKGAVERTVVLPEGTWKGDDGSVIQGPAAVKTAAPLSRLPYYRKQV